MPGRECFNYFRIIDPEELVPIGDKLVDRVEEDFPSSLGRSLEMMRG
jgi:hypothetical protein